MKFQEPENPNYVATVIRVRNLVDLEGLDNLKAIPAFGYQALVSKDTPLDSLGVLFTAESQVSLDFAYNNNLHRHADLNIDESQTGYLEDSRRVKALKLRGHQSNALFMPLEAFSYLGVKPEDFTEGDTFDKIGDKEIVRKYLVKQPANARKIDKNSIPKFRRVDERYFPLHFDTENYWRNAHAVPANAPVVVTQKLHGTSVRIAHTVVKRKLSWLEKLAKRVGVKVAETEYDHVYGSRKVTKDVNNPDQNHYYDTDLWSLKGKELDDLIPENYIVFGELIGWTPDGSPIQKDYTYDVPVGDAHLYIYRVAIVTHGGFTVDLSWDQVRHFAEDRGLRVVPELWRGRHDEFEVDEFIDTVFSGVDGYWQAVPLSSQKTVDEGVCIRTDIGRAPYVLKAKSPIFLGHETAMLDAEAVDIEAEESVE